MLWSLESSHDDPHGDILLLCDGRTVAKIPLDDAPVVQRYLARFIMKACNVYTQVDLTAISEIFLFHR